MDEARDTRVDLVKLITEYLGNGGLFNPELMEHEKVRDLLMDCRNEIITRRDIINEQNKIIQEQVANITKLCNRVEYLENVVADMSWKAEADRNYYETKPKETW